MTHPVQHISVSITRPSDEVYAFTANPENIPRWAAGLGSSVTRGDGEWLAQSPMGKVRIKFAEKNAFGVLDHQVTLESGITVFNPMRVQSNGTGSEVVFTLHRLPGMSDEQFLEDAGRVRQDLDRLRALLGK